MAKQTKSEFDLSGLQYADTATSTPAPKKQSEDFDLSGLNYGDTSSTTTPLSQPSFSDIVGAPSKQFNQAVNQLRGGQYGAGTINILNSLLSTAALPFTVGMEGLKRIPYVGQPAAEGLTNIFNLPAEAVQGGERGIDYLLRKAGVSEQALKPTPTSQALSQLNQGLATILAGKVAEGAIPEKIQPIIKGETNAVQEPSTTEEVPRTGSGRENIPLRSEEMGQGEQGQETTSTRETPQTTPTVPLQGTQVTNFEMKQNAGEILGNKGITIETIPQMQEAIKMLGGRQQFLDAFESVRPQLEEQGYVKEAPHEFARRVIAGDLLGDTDYANIEEHVRNLPADSDIYSPPQKVEIPQFANTNEAVDYGRQNTDKISQLEAALADARADEATVVNDFKNKRISFDVAQAVGNRAHTLHEAWDAAKNPENQEKIIKEPETILRAAYKDEIGKVHPGFNHPEILQRLGVEGFETPESRNTPQFGFVTTRRGFVPREEIGEIAKKSGQDLKQFEENEPVHSNEISAPSQLNVPLSEAKNLTETPSKTPKVSESSTEKEQSRTTGIRQETLERTTGGAVKPGKGITTEVGIQRGRDLLKQGTDPEAIIQRVKDTGQISPDDMSVLRAKIEELDRNAQQAQDAAEKDPILQPEADRLNNERIEFEIRQKPAATAWSNTGRFMQGETDIDTGNFYSMRKAVQEKYGRDLTADEAKEVRDIVSRVKATRESVDQWQAKLYKQLERAYTKPIKPTEGAISKMQAQTNMGRTIWEHAKKNYIDPGNVDFEDMLTNTAHDLGVSRREVAEAFEKPKSVRTISDQLYKMMDARRKAIRNARMWLDVRNAPAMTKALQMLKAVTFGIKVLGHPVGTITHAGFNMFRPSEAAAYWRDGVQNTFRFWASKTYHEKMIQDLVNDPDFIFWKRSGLNIDPATSYDPYQEYAKWWGKFGESGVRSMDALKTYRLSLAKQIFDRAPEDMKNADYAKLVARTVNHTSGYSDFLRGQGSIGRGIGDVMFAPSLEFARWSRIIGDPARALKTFANWGKATPEERTIALTGLRRAAEGGAVFFGALAANNGLNIALGNKQRVNFTDPTKSDFLRFKIGDKAIDPTGGMTVPVRFISRIMEELVKARTKRTGFEGIKSAVGDYTRGKLAPWSGTITDVAVGTDYMGRPLPRPIYSGKTTPQKPQYTLPEYAIEQFGPIPVEGAAREIADVWKQKGMDNTQINDILNALGVFGAEGIGLRVSPEPQTPRQRKVYSYGN